MKPVKVNFKLILNILFCVYMAIALLPILSKNIGNMAVLIICVLMFLITFVSSIQKMTIFWPTMALWVIILVVQYLRVSKSTTSGNLLSNLLFFFPMILFASGAREKQDQSDILVLALFFIMQTYVAVVNIVALAQNPRIQKFLTAGLAYFVSQYRHTNVGTLTNVFMSLLTALIACITLQYTKGRKQIIRILLLAVILVNNIYVFMAGSLIAALSLATGEVVFLVNLLVKNKKIKVVLFLLIIALSVFFFLFFETIASSILEQNILGDYYEERLRDILSGIQGQNYGITAEKRSEDYFTSVASFAKNPLIGVGLLYSAERTVVGMHSEILDFLARFGLIGTFCFGVFLYSWYRSVRFREQKFAAVRVEIFPVILAIILYAALNPMITMQAGVVIWFILPLTVSLCKSMNQRVLPNVL